jgi:hypothetical protein
MIKEQFAEAVGDANYLKIFIARRRVAGLLVGRHDACIVVPLIWRAIAHAASYLVGGAVVASVLSWMFLGWPPEPAGREPRKAISQIGCDR